MIKYILLGFLNYGSMTGYELKQSIDSSTSHFWHAHHSQIYTTLREMEKEGLVSSQYIQENGQPDRRVYTISESGKQDLVEWLNQPMSEMPPVKDEFLVRMFFSGQRDPKKVVAELLVQNEMHKRQLSVYQSILPKTIDQNAEMVPELAHEAKFWRATLEMGIAYEKIYVEWTERAIQMIGNL